MTTDLFIGASQAPAILGLDPFKTAQELFNELTGRTSAFVGNEHTSRGKHLEPGLCSWWCELAAAERREAQYSSRGAVLGNGQLQVFHPVQRWARATPDVVAEALPVGLERRVLVAVDVKAPSSTRKKVGEEWVDVWSEAKQLAPEHYIAQSTYQQGVLLAAGVPVECGELAAGPSWGKLIRVRVGFDPELFALILETAERFRACVIAGELSPEFQDKEPEDE